MAQVQVEDKDAHQRLTNVISTEDRSVINKVYNNWANDYEADMAAVQYFGPTELMKYIDRLNVPKEGKILDICAGTGGVGRGLVKLGYSDIHAIDGSESMLARAKEEGNYKSYTQLLFEPSSKLPFEDNTYDCVLLAGVFAPGHLPIVALREACRVAKIGGVVAWICCDPNYYEDKDSQYANGGFQKILDELKAKGAWKERTGFPISVPYIEYSSGFVMAFDKTGNV